MWRIVRMHLDVACILFPLYGYRSHENDFYIYTNSFIGQGLKKEEEPQLHDVFCG
jgi:hypothetical protein